MGKATRLFTTETKLSGLTKTMIPGQNMETHLPQITERVLFVDVLKHRQKVFAQGTQEEVEFECPMAVDLNYLKSHLTTTYDEWDELDAKIGHLRWELLAL